VLGKRDRFWRRGRTYVSPPDDVLELLESILCMKTIDSITSDDMKI